MTAIQDSKADFIQGCRNKYRDPCNEVLLEEVRGNIDQGKGASSQTSLTGFLLKADHGDDTSPGGGWGMRNRTR